jgi:hypothetical protein
MPNNGHKQTIKTIKRIKTIKKKLLFMNVRVEFEFLISRNFSSGRHVSASRQRKQIESVDRKTLFAEEEKA